MATPTSDGQQEKDTKAALYSSVSLTTKTTTTANGVPKRNLGRSSRRRRKKMREIQQAEELLLSQQPKQSSSLSERGINDKIIPSDRSRVWPGVEERRRSLLLSPTSNNDDGAIEKNASKLLNQLGYVPGNAIQVAARASSVPLLEKYCQGDEPIVLQLYPIALRDEHTGRKTNQKFKRRKRIRLQQQQQQQQTPSDPSIEETKDGTQNTSSDTLNQKEEDFVVEPFPTHYWLTHPLLRTLVSKLELNCMGVQLEHRLAKDPMAMACMEQANLAYGQERYNLLTDNDITFIQQRKWERAFDPQRGVAGIRNYASVKCLHAHVAHYLSQGNGSSHNILGKWVMEDIAKMLNANNIVPAIVDKKTSNDQSVQQNNKTNSQDGDDSEHGITKKSAGCYHCASSDHRAKECPQATCRNCGEQGHDAGGCPTRIPTPVDRGHFAAQANGDSTTTATNLFSFVELFAGMGGFRVALDKLGGQCVFASDMDRFCVQTYQANFGGDRPAGDIARIDSEWIPNHDLLVGGFPCQPFSSSGSRQGMEDPEKGLLFREIVRIMQAKQPKAFLLENVRGLVLHDEGRTMQVIVQELKRCGYNVQWELLDAVHLLPQERCRLFIVGIRNDICQQKAHNGSSVFKFPYLPNLKRGVQDILHDKEHDSLSQEELDKLTLSTHQIGKVCSQSYTQQHPEARFLADLTKPAKTLQASYTKYMVGSQFVPVVAVNNHSRDDQKHAAISECKLTANDSSWRRFSSREAARLQGFPETFQLCSQRAYHMLGNAVAPPLIAMIAAPLLQAIGVAVPNNDGMEWGWNVTKQLLVDAAPNDLRREELQQKLVSCHFSDGLVKRIAN